MNGVSEAASAKVWGTYTSMTKECGMDTEKKQCVAFPVGSCKGGIGYALSALLLNAGFGKRRLAHTTIAQRSILLRERVRMRRMVCLK